MNVSDPHSHMSSRQLNVTVNPDNYAFIDAQFVENIPGKSGNLTVSLKLFVSVPASPSRVSRNRDYLGLGVFVAILFTE